MRDSIEVEVLPMKAVGTVKPPGRRKGRVARRSWAVDVKGAFLKGSKGKPPQNLRS